MSDFEIFQDNCNVSLASFIKKDQNKKTIAKMLWRIANHNIEYANYLCFEILAEYLCSTSVNDVVAAVKQKKLGWNHPSFEPFEKKQNEFDDFLIHPPEVEEGVIECHRCGSKKTFSFSKQTRRADESSTVFVRCSNCNNTFKL